MEQEAITEIGNIVLNACFSSLSELLNSDFQCTLPTYHLGLIGEVVSAQTNIDDNMMLLLKMDFSMPNKQIDGYLVFLLTLSSFKVLIDLVDQFLSGIHEN